jgi:hypothetical protein
MNKLYIFQEYEVAKWYVDPTAQGIGITKKSLDTKFDLRYEIQQWINKNCQGNVWILNNLEHSNTLIAVWFEHNHDKTLFVLTWSDDIEIIHSI